MNQFKGTKREFIGRDTRGSYYKYDVREDSKQNKLLNPAVGRV